VQACIKGVTPDRAPVALWRHFPVDDQSPASLAASVLHFQRTYDFDLVKVTPASSFCLKDWGVDDQWNGNVEGTREYTRYVIHEPRDWEKLAVLDSTAPHLADQLDCLRIIRRELDSNTPLLQTIFSPLAQAKNLAGAETLLEHLKLYPNALMKGLHTIAVTTRRYIEAIIETGVDGIFYAVQHAQAGLLTQEQYREFQLPFDQQILEPAQNLWCNLLHLHGREIYFSLFLSLPFPLINWHDRETGPTLAEAQKQFRGAVCGGLRQNTLVYADRLKVMEEACEAINQTSGKRLILGTGCVVPIIASHGNIMAARLSVDSRFSPGG
jgi:uroporphyrinogen decarboxylase